VGLEMSEKLDALMKNYYKKTTPSTEVVVFHVQYTDERWVSQLSCPSEEWLKSLDFGIYTVPVASMELYDMENDHAACEEAFMLTNNINESWWKNSKVKKLFEGIHCRSTSTGDIVTVSRKGSVNAYKCDAMGWSIMVVPSRRNE
jgi:hypothetical protein